jgi:asparagine synthase (glutamine-hydrolysing)
MCGIAGIISPFAADTNISKLKIMAETLAHRGPDGEGVWLSPKKLAGLAHRRLSVIDLSNKAMQPMHYIDRYSIVFNGEIYNYIELKRDLKKAGYHFSNESDTEVILAAYDCYKEKCLQFFDGMFAFAIWDEYEQSLFAARDRFGEKPFYYFKDQQRFFFASEMKALWAAGIQKSISERMLLNYIALGYVQNPSDSAQTFFNNIFSLPSAHYLTLQKNVLNIERYWSLDKQASIDVKESDAIVKIDALLNASVSKRLRSDVPIGTSLSGGIDSTSIIHFIQQNQKNNLKTFSAIFPSFEKDESKYVDLASHFFNVENTKVFTDEKGLINDFEKLMFHQEEPFPSSSIFAQYKVYETAKANGVSVLLDGQGADEIFAGYNRYIHWFLQELVSRNHFADFFKEKKQFKKNQTSYSWGMKNFIAAFLPSHACIALEKIEYNKIIRNNDVSKALLHSLKGREWEGIHKPVVTKLNDILSYNVTEAGLEELLRYCDRNAMAHGCEVRLPYLNHELVSYVFSLPSRFKMNNGFTKAILRKLMLNKIPDEINWRTDKIGFEPPQKKWMESPVLLDFVHEAKKNLVANRILKPQVLQKQNKSLGAHESNNFDWRYLCVSQMMNTP